MPIELPAIPKVSQQPTLQPHKDTANIVLFKKIMQHLCVKFLLTPKKISFFYSPYKIRWHLDRVSGRVCSYPPTASGEHQQCGMRRVSAAAGAHNDYLCTTQAAS